eukprot:Opistho-2@36782
MVKYAQYLDSHAVPDWRQRYLDYRSLKHRIHEVLIEKSPPKTRRRGSFSFIVRDYDGVPATRTSTLSHDNIDLSFTALLDLELAKINNFFHVKLEQSKVRLDSLVRQLDGVPAFNPRMGLGDDLEVEIIDETAPLLTEEARDAMNRSADGSSLTGSINSRRSSRPPPLRRLRSWLSDVRETREINNEPENYVARTLKLEFCEFYSMVESLRSYQILNYTGFVKILKKHDKMLGVKLQEEYIRKVQAAPFFQRSELDRISNETEKILAERMGFKDPSNDAKKLGEYSKRKNKHDHKWSMFMAGLYVGACLPMVIMLIVTASEADGFSTWKPQYTMYRGLILPICFCYLFGANVYLWIRNNINYVFIFEFDATNYLTHAQIFEMAGLMSLLWVVCVYLTVHHTTIVPAEYMPVTLFLVYILYFINPLRIFHRSARYWVIYHILRVFSAPFTKVRFADFWLADQFNSMAIMFIDMEFLFCQTLVIATNGSSDPFRCKGWPVGVRPVLSALPAWLRFLQCIRRFVDTRNAFPHLANAAKYSTTFFVVLFSTLDDANQPSPGGTEWTIYRKLWVCSSIIATCFTYWWDIKMDWGLLQKTGPRFLRRELLFPRMFYYVCMVGDLLMRMLWTLTVSPQIIGVSLPSDILRTCLAFAELFRLCVEHSSCGERVSQRLRPISAGIQTAPCPSLFCQLSMCTSLFGYLAFDSRVMCEIISRYPSLNRWACHFVEPFVGACARCPPSLLESTHIVYAANGHRCILLLAR